MSPIAARPTSAARSPRPAGRSRAASGATPTRQRKKQVLLRFAELIREHAEELALLETLDVGKPIANSLKVDVPFCANCIQYYAELADKLTDEIAPVGPNDVAMVRKEPLGVVGAIVPWNYPLIIAAWKLGPALVAGNSVVLKPAEQSPLGALMLGRLGKEAGLPDGVLNVVPGFGEKAGKPLALHPDVDMIAFTGSTEVGKLMLVYAGESNMKRVALECGGKSPCPTPILTPPQRRSRGASITIRARPAMRAHACWCTPRSARRWLRKSPRCRRRRFRLGIRSTPGRNLAL
jgi:acyl-CoA reductase-like NAD-dependent aldehyde dehydrogenase